MVSKGVRFFELEMMKIIKCERKKCREVKRGMTNKNADK